MNDAGTVATAESREAASRLLAIVAEMISEAQPARARAVALDSAFERDLGLDSLARVELMMRVERAFGLTLPSEALGSVETPRDLLYLVLDGSATERALDDTIHVLGGATDDALPDDAGTWREVLDWHAARRPDRIQTHYYDDDDREHDLSYAGLKAGAESFAGALVRRGVEPGQTVAIMLPTGFDYCFSFFGCLLCGAIPVPIYPPVRLAQLEDHLRRHQSILANAEVVALITVPEARALSLLLRAQVPSLRHVITPAELERGGALHMRPRVSGEDIAFLQYTSGSTGSPKGVMLTHANLLANVRAMGRAVQSTSSDVFVSWLPLYHDMGLIGAWLGSLYHGFPLVLMSPLAFLARPQRWLWALHRHRGTLSAAPNFAYELCARKIDEAHLGGLDLSTWRFAFNGAEPVSADTLAAFRHRFAPYGLRPGSLAPVYGLAECSVGLAIPPPGRGPRIDCIDRAQFAACGRAVPAPGNGPDVLRMVACGYPLDGHDIRIVDASGCELPERQQGRLHFRGPSATRGYYRNPAETKKLISGDWLDSGDYAYVAGGEVYITGRVKDLIIKGGRNIYPYDLEQAVGAIPGIRKGCVAVFGSTDRVSGTERLVVMAETRERDDAVREKLRERINEAAVDAIGMPPDTIVLVPPHTVLKTSSGKIRRAASRERYERGDLHTHRLPVWWQMTRLAVSAAWPQLRRARDSAAVCLYAGYATICFLLLGIPTWIVAAALGPSRATRGIVHRATRAFFGLAHIPLTGRGLENLPATPAVLAINHTSYLDGVALLAVLPPEFPIAFAAKRELTRHWVSRIFLRALRTEFVERFDAKQAVEDLGQLSAALQQGRFPAFFPEGTMQAQAGLKPFRSGAFVAAVRAGVPVVPIAIAGARSLLRCDTWRLRRGAIRITVLPSIRPRGDDWKATVELRNDVRAAILAACGEPDLAP